VRCHVCWSKVCALRNLSETILLTPPLSSFCTSISHAAIALAHCSRRYEYHWADGQTIKKAIKVSAPEYIDFLMTWVQGQLDDETIFPSKIGALPTFHFVFLLYALPPVC
jgi:MOB kinase activator 1